MKHLFLLSLLSHGPASHPLRLVALVLVGLLLMALVAPTASADFSLVKIENQNMEGTLKLKPGDLFSAGFVFRVRRPHPWTQVKIVAPAMVVKYRCEGDSTNTVKSFVVQGATGYEYNRLVEPDDERWAPTKDTNLADGFQFVTTVGDLCASYPTKVMIVDGGTKGVDFAARVAFKAPDGSTTPLPSMTLEIKFHYRDPRAKGHANIDCSDRVQNPSPGIPACTAKWSATKSLIPAVYQEPGDGQLQSQINGHVFIDANGNGAQDVAGVTYPIALDNFTERGLAGVPIEVVDVFTGAVVNSQLTWAFTRTVDGVTTIISPYHGGYNLTVPVPGNYIVRQAQQVVGYISTTPDQTTVYVPDNAAVTYDFGEQPIP